MLNIQKNVDLSRYSTMQIGGPAKYFVVVRDRTGLVEAFKWARRKDLPYIILGEGTNTIFSNAGYKGLVIKNEIGGISLQNSTLQSGAGIHWDELVEQSVKKGLSGIEALSMIPGTAGAAPIQNIGAYGQEISQVISEIAAYDIKDEKFVVLKNEDCGFRYRDSIFKSEEKGRYAVVSIKLQLSEEQMQPPFYESLQRYMDEQNITDYSPANIRKSVMEIRKVRLPDPSVVPNSGSFFTNPFINPEAYEQLRKKFPDIKAHKANDKYKVSAGWLIENSDIDLKGKKLKLFETNKLVITNPDHANFKELVDFRDKIIDAVQNKFGITLEQEPQIIS